MTTGNTGSKNIININSNSTVEVSTIAPLKNVALCSRALERIINRPQHLPGMAVLYSPAGFGKTYAAIYAMNKFNAVYVQVMSSWTRKALLIAIAKELSIAPADTLYDLTEQVSERLALSGRPLIIDEMDHVVKKGYTEVIRDIYEGSRAPILLIGEEGLPRELQEWERFHSRILDFVPAQPADADDARVLMKFYCKKVDISDDLLDSLAIAARGSLRRICVNLDKIEETALSSGKKVIDLGVWSAFKKGFWTGQAEERHFT